MKENTMRACQATQIEWISYSFTSICEGLIVVGNCCAPEGRIAGSNGSHSGSTELDSVHIVSGCGGPVRASANVGVSGPQEGRIAGLNLGGEGGLSGCWAWNGTEL